MVRSERAGRSALSGWRLAWLTGVAGLALAIPACGGGGEPRAEGGEPHDVAGPEKPSGTGPAAIHHESLRGVEKEIEQALAPAGGPAATPDYPAAAAGARKLIEGADAILEDAPSTLRDEDRLRYEGLVAQLKDRATVLRAAAEAHEKLKAVRSYQQLTANCVKCHSQFAPEAPSGAGEGR